MQDQETVFEKYMMVGGPELDMHYVNQSEFKTWFRAPLDW